MKDYTNSQMSALIDEHIHNEKCRAILKLRFIDGLTYEKIAENDQVNLTPRRVAYLVSKNVLVLEQFL